MDNQEIVLKVENVKKRYRLGMIGGGTLRGDLQSWWARIRGKEDPNTKVGEVIDTKKGSFMALDDISFEVKKGERLGIIGGNGAGKSTTLKILSRVTAPTEGKVYINGRISSMLEVGTGFHQELSGRENIYLNGAILGMSKEEVDSKINDIIEFSECAQFIDTPVKRYSSGMYVKLAFAVAAHLDSEIMIMDEVLAVGDMQFQKKCLSKMRQAAIEDGKTVLYVSHNMSTIAQLCDRCIVLNKGKVIFDGNVDDGIKVYMENGMDSVVKRNYREYKRPAWLTSQDIRIEEIEFLEKDNNIFVDNENIIMKIIWKNNANIKDLCLRWEINGQDGTPIGTSLIESFYCGRVGDKGQIILKYNFPELMPGSYTSYVTFYYKDQYGGNMDIDCVRGLLFDKKFVLNNNINWSAKRWGNVKFNSPELVNSL